ncbi:hypothetical protein MHO82_21180 [Vibrio sp. Of7-15]|uniref:hypothetical protein n=1 Tax=Vibrio sp. Of7-15 TaxID=2724879 RepID=UPI001EF290A8|nr:hypothetical protein [Vibrio sp. Of7-15]MCG7499383.1 hypothetical protein [Vibrio sp. Of7-15]
MSWQTASFQWPNSAQSIQAGCESVLDQLPSTTATATTRLHTVSGKVSFNRHPLSESAQAHLGLRQQLDTLLCQGQVLSVHPYQYQVGHQVASGHHLSPDRAVSILADKLLDTNDKHKPIGQCHALGWMIAESSLAQFAKCTQTLFEVVNIPELGMVARRLAKEQQLQSDKFTQPHAVFQPRFMPNANIHSALLREAMAWQGAQVAQLESLAADRQTPVDKLSQLAQKRGQRLHDWQRAINQLKDSSVPLLTFEATGTPDVLATLLKQSQPPSREHSYTFAALFLSTEPLTFLSELFA